MYFQVKVHQDILKLRCWQLSFIWYKAFSKRKKRSRTSISVSYSQRILKKDISQEQKELLAWNEKHFSILFKRILRNCIRPESGPLSLKHHLNTNRYQKVDTNGDKNVSNKFKSLIKNHKSCLTESDTKNILKNNWKSSSFYVLPKVLKSKKIIDEINKYNDICVNMEPRKFLEGRLTAVAQILLFKAS